MLANYGVLPARSTLEDAAQNIRANVLKLKGEGFQHGTPALQGMFMTKDQRPAQSFSPGRTAFRNRPWRQRLFETSFENAVEFVSRTTCFGT